MKITIKNITDRLPSSNPSKNKTVILGFLVKQVQKTIEIKPKQEIVLEIPSLTSQIKKFLMMKLIEVSDVSIKKDKAVQNDTVKPNIEPVNEPQNEIIEDESIKTDDTEAKKIKKQFRAKD